MAKEKIEEAEKPEEKKVQKKGKPDLKEKRSGRVVRILATDIEGSMKIITGIAEIKGIGNNMANVIILKLGLDKKKRMQDLSDPEIDKIETAITNPASLGVPDWMLNRRKDLDTGKSLHLSTNDLIFAKKSDIDLMGEIKSYKGLRHSRGAKVRGQRTASTGRGRVAVGVQKKKIAGAQAVAAKDEKKK